MASDLPHVARVAVEGTFNSERFVNILHFAKRDSQPYTSGELSALLAILDDAATEPRSLLEIFEHLDVGCVIDTITATTLDTTTPLQVSTTVSLAGTAVGADMPPMLAAVLKWGTDIASRRFRGRTFLTGLNAAFVDGTNSDRLSAGAQSDLSGGASDFMNGWGSDVDQAFVILSATERAANALVPFREVISASVNPLICVQRRRRERP